jgi:hypothetical protein
LKKISELGTFAETTNFKHAAKMEAIIFSETLVRTRTTRRHIPDEGVHQESVSRICGFQNRGYFLRNALITENCRWNSDKKMNKFHENSSIACKVTIYSYRNTVQMNREMY